MADQGGDHHYRPHTYNKLREAAEDHHLSGAYIRSIVKQLTTSKPKSSSSTHQFPSAAAADLSKMNKNGLQQQLEAQGQSQQQQKKQVRRRMHTARPYQERVLNMAEARREIVAALKFHRASMKQAQEKQQLRLQLEQQQQAFIDPVPNPSMYPNISSLTSCNSNFVHDSAHPISPNFNCSTDPSPWYSTASSSYPSSIAQLQLHHDSFNCLSLPNQLPLGLNLNFQGFNNIVTTMYTAPKAPQRVDKLPLPSPTSSPSSSYSTSTPSPSRMPMSGGSLISIPETMHEPKGLGLHQVMDDEVMAEIRSIGEQHEIEWNDTVNAVTSAWWCKFLKSMEADQSGEQKDTHTAAAADEIHMPLWMNDFYGDDANEYYFPVDQSYLDDYLTEDYLLDAAAAALPW